ncbi:MAG: GNAT family N-acetyltransferase [Acidimicrobiia bacterium]
MTPALETGRLRLAPLETSDAAEMLSILGDDQLYVFTGGRPPTLAELEERYRAQLAGSPSKGETWHNWIIRLIEDRVAVGFVQATVTDVEADIAWLIGVDWQGRGLATEAATAMIEWLVAGGTRRLVAHIHPDHAASGKVAAALGLVPTGEVDFDGETIWER